jgi:hypothetical protein
LASGVVLCSDQSSEERTKLLPRDYLERSPIFDLDIGEKIADEPVAFVWRPDLPGISDIRRIILVLTINLVINRIVHRQEFELTS